MPRWYQRLGCRKDTKDLRDIPMGLVLPPIPVSGLIDYTDKMTPVRNQGDEGTCVAFASAVGVKEYQDSIEYKRAVRLSPRYLYAACKRMDGIPQEEGTYPRIAMKILMKFGVCPESFWPYRPHQKDKAKKDAGKYSKKYRIKSYARIDGVLEMKRSLMVNGPFLAGVQVYDNWFTAASENTGIISLPKIKDELRGGHAICIMGYDDEEGLFKFKNSWGSKWGGAGYGYLPYEYMKKYCMDAWSATDLIEDAEMLIASREKVISWWG